MGLEAACRGDGRGWNGSVAGMVSDGSETRLEWVQMEMTGDGCIFCPGAGL